MIILCIPIVLFIVSYIIEIKGFMMLGVMGEMQHRRKAMHTLLAGAIANKIFAVFASLILVSASPILCICIGLVVGIVFDGLLFLGVWLFGN